MKMQVVVRFQIPGIHHWPSCHIEDVSYLKELHRHNFHFEAKAFVYHGDRDKEFVMMQKELKDFLLEHFYDKQLGAMNLGDWSCERLAEHLLKKFKYLSEVSVFEDGENGAILWQE